MSSDGPAGRPVFGLALTAVAAPPDIAKRPFRPSFRSLLEALPPRLRTQPVLDDVVQVHHSQGASWLTVDGRDSNWVVIAHWDGTVAASFSAVETDGSNAALLAYGEGNVRDDGIKVNEGPLAAAWRIAGELLPELGCRGEGRLCVFVDGTLPRFSGGPPEFVVERRVEIRPPSSQQVDDVVREFRRSTGEYVEEPEAPG